MTRLLLIRHGETDHNTQGRFLGQVNPPLNERGRRQARMLRSRLTGTKCRIAYTSDLGRARETAQLILGQRETLIYEDPRLRELSFGTWDGLTRAEVEEEDPETLSAWEANAMDIAPSGGETLAEFSERVRTALASILDTHQAGETVIIVTHGGVLKMIFCMALGLSPDMHWQFRVENASISEVVFHPAGGIIGLLNGTTHLQDDNPDLFSAYEDRYGTRPKRG